MPPTSPTSVKESAVTNPNEVDEENGKDGVDVGEKTDHSLDDPSCSHVGVNTTEPGKQNQSTQVETSEYERQGRQIFRDMVLSSRATNEEREKRLPASIHLQQMANNVLKKHQLIYSEMVNKLELDKGLEYKALEIMCDELFSAEEATWGRVVTLCAFCIELERQCQENNLEHVSLYVADSVWHYNRTRITNWISKQAKGWDTVIDLFPDCQKSEGGVLKTLLYAGLGLAAVASVLKVVR